MDATTKGWFYGQRYDPKDGGGRIASGTAIESNAGAVADEKYFDNYKTDMANSKAWGKSPVAIEQQALLGLVTHLLMRLFLHN